MKQTIALWLAALFLLISTQVHAVVLVGFGFGQSTASCTTTSAAISHTTQSAGFIYSSTSSQGINVTGNWTISAVRVFTADAGTSHVELRTTATGGDLIGSASDSRTHVDSGMTEYTWTSKPSVSAGTVYIHIVPDSGTLVVGTDNGNPYGGATYLATENGVAIDYADFAFEVYKCDD